MYRNAIVSTRIGVELPNTATNTAASAIPGKDMMMSMIRMRTSETALFAVAAIEPRIAAATSATAVAPIPMTRENREP